MRNVRIRGVAVAAVLVLALGLQVAAPNPAQSQPVQQVLGKTIGQWSAVWWQWALSIPPDKNPLLDATGEFAGVNQTGPVFFLAGYFGSGAVTRTCTVPAGKCLFFPIYNWVWVKLSPTRKPRPG